MAYVIAFPKVVQDKLGQEASLALVDTLNKMQEFHSNNTLEIAEQRFERRLMEVKADLIKWMFLFWLGQIGAFLVFLK